MSVLMAEAPRLRQQSKLYDSMSKNANFCKQIIPTLHNYF